MMKRKAMQNGGNGAGTKILFAAFALWLAVRPVPALAQICESESTAEDKIDDMNDKIVDRIKEFVEQEKNFNSNKYGQMMRTEVVERLKEYGNQLTEPMSQLWVEMKPALKKMTAQLYVARVDQTMQIGKFMDAEMVNEVMSALQNQQVEGRRRYTGEGESACQVDTVSANNTKAASMSRAVSRALTVEGEKRRNNSVGTPSAKGAAADQKDLWAEYVKYFCDPNLGDQGCLVAGNPTTAGRHTDVPTLLWDNQQTLDLANPETRRIITAATRYMIAPIALDVVPEKVVDTPQGHEALLMRHAHAARVNTIYNVVDQMIAERTGGSGSDVQAIRAEAGVPKAEASQNASYRELQEAMARDRFQNPDYMGRMVASPEQLVREQGSVNAQRLQELNDMYKRLEEMVFMESAVYAQDLDGQMPATPKSTKFLRD